VTAPAPQQPAPAVAAPYSLRRVLLVVGAVLFVLAAFAAGGDTLGGISAWSWGFGAFAAWCLSWSVP
jgi:hypothetical protein